MANFKKHLVESPLKLGNDAFRNKGYEAAIQFYVKALRIMPGLASLIGSNIRLAQSRAKDLKTSGKLRVGVCGWELAHNAAGRAYTLAQLYKTFADVEIIGSILPKHGKEVWAPLRNARIPIHSFVVEEEERFIELAIELVSAHPFDLVHLSKPRAPNIIFGILYKLIWNARVIMDIDDEELAFAGADQPLDVQLYLNEHSTLPPLRNLSGRIWTQIAVGLAHEFDGITVSNPALRSRYGGVIIRHARGGWAIRANATIRLRNRDKYGIPAGKQVVLFFGTPRQHKGLEAISDAISKQNRTDIVFAIVGEFPDAALKARLLAKRAVQYVFLGHQPVESLEEITSIGDYCILPPATEKMVAQFQVPAKLTDALAAGMVVIATPLPAIADFVAAGAVVPCAGDLSETLRQVLAGVVDLESVQKAAVHFFQTELSISVNASKLECLTAPGVLQGGPPSDLLIRALVGAPGYDEWPVAALATYPFESAGSLTAQLAPISALPTISSLFAPAPCTSPELRPSAPAANFLPMALGPKLPITVLIITWDVGHNPLGRSYMLAEVVQRIARHSLLVGFQFPRYGDAIWEPVREGQLPVITLPGSNLPEFYSSLQNIASRIKPDVVIACKARLPSVALGMMIKEKWGCPLIVDVDDHELSFFTDQSELSLDELAAMPAGAASQDTEPYAELWTRLTQSLCKSADEIIVSNVALQHAFGGTIVPHVRDENTFDPARYNKAEIRRRYGVSADAKIVLFFGTPRVHKGVATLAHAIGQITDPKFQLLVVGTAPDRRVTAKLDQLAPGRVIYLPNQSFTAIPEILAMADVVCLPQDEGHAISRFQLPAKAIDAVAMGIPLLVSNTSPLQQLVSDQVAELVSTENMPAALQRVGGDSEHGKRWQKNVRSKFLSHYSYAAAAVQMRELIQRSLSRKTRNIGPSTARLIAVSNHVLGLPLASTPEHRKPGIDVVVFWKQNDTGLYGRRHDMVIKYLASRPDVRKVVVFDAPMSEFDLVKRQQADPGANQHRWIYVGTYEKLLGTQDSEKISYNVFVFPPGKYRNQDNDTKKPHLLEGYLPYIDEVLQREGVSPKESVFWIYPKNYSAPTLIQHFKPAKVVVDVVDDHRTWPGISENEKLKLTENYRATLALADMAFTNCEPVQKSMQGFFPNILLVPNGCDSSPPTVIPKYSKEFDAFSKWPGKTIGYIGNLEAKIDLELIGKLAEHFPTCQIVLIGSTHANPAALQLKRYQNVRMPGVVAYKWAGAWVSRFDVGLLPHLNIALTRSMNPLKLFVCLALNVPVVSTEIDNIERNSEMVRIAANHQDFILAVETTLAQGRPKENLSIDYVALNCWESRLSGYVDELLNSTLNLI
jgi:glycosyltransferase involved in cell wall biosynthesis